MLLYIKKRINLAALVYCALSSCFWMIYVAKWTYLRYTGAFDTAYFMQSMWSLKRGSLSSSIIGSSNFLVDHCHFLVFLLAPLHWIFPDPLFLQALKITAFFAGTFVFFLILKRTVNPFIAFGAMVAFSIAPANIAMLRFAFSYEALAVPLVLLIYKFFNDQRFGPYLICCILLMLVKEQMPLVVMFMGFSAFFFKKEGRFKWAWIPFILGLTVFIVEVFFLLPYVREAIHIKPFLYWNRYSQFGNTPLEILGFLISHPDQIWAKCLSAANIRWYNDLFGVWGGLAFLSPHFLLPAFPIFLKMALSSQAVEHSVTTVYYACVFTPFVFLATWNTLSYFPIKQRFYVQNFTLTLMLIHGLSYIPLWQNIPSSDARSAVIHKLIDEIPKEASVLSGRKALPYLADRTRLYQLKDYLSGTYYISGVQFDPDEDVDYILIDFTELTNMKRSAQLRLTALNFDPRFKVKESIEDATLLVRDEKGNGTGHLIERQPTPFLKDAKDGLVFEKNLVLQAVTFPREFSQRAHVFPTTMYWQSKGKIRQLDEIRIRITQGERIFYEKKRRIGTSIYPSTRWNKKEFVKENYSYLLPELSVGQYTMEIQILNPSTNQWSEPFKESFNVI